MSSAQLRFVDVFAGCGGLSLGLRAAGLFELFAIEKNEMAFETLKHNLFGDIKPKGWPSWLEFEPHNIRTFLKDHRENLLSLENSVDLLAGGPPCQGFSTAGNRKSLDGRNYLMHSYAELVSLLKPRFILFENVRGFTMPFKSSRADGGASKSPADRIISRLKKLGYTDVRGKLIDFSQFGIPQRRKRFIIFGSTSNCAPRFFDELPKVAAELLSLRGLKKRCSVADALGDLVVGGSEDFDPQAPRFKLGKYGPAITDFQKWCRNGLVADTIPDSHRIPNHRPDTVEIFKALIRDAPKARSLTVKELKLYGLKKRNVTVLDASHPAMTITSIPDDMIHHCEPRVLTVRECARLQSFPDSFEFKGKYTTGGKARKLEVPRYTQVGNAIPPLFAEIAGLVIRKIVECDKS